MLRLIIEKSEKSFLPEIGAYVEYFERNGFLVTVATKNAYDPRDFDVILLFHGFHPFWRKYPAWIIGEYHSLSTGRYNKLKDILKRIVNVRSDVNVFLNDDVRRYMHFGANRDHMYRQMGYYNHYIKEGSSSKKEFDVVYTGSIRPGVEAALIHLASLGVSVAVAGNTKPIMHRNIRSFGRVNVSEAYRIMASSKYGLNITPDVFPLNIQDSTKVIEYCAMGLGVITNKYKWICDFEAQRQCRFLDIKSIRNKQDLSGFDFVIPDVSDLTWERVMNNSGISENLLEKIRCNHEKAN